MISGNRRRRMVGIIVLSMSRNHEILTINIEIYHEFRQTDSREIENWISIQVFIYEDRPTCFVDLCGFCGCFLGNHIRTKAG